MRHTIDRWLKETKVGQFIFTSIAVISLVVTIPFLDLKEFLDE